MNSHKKTRLVVQCLLTLLILGACAILLSSGSAAKVSQIGRSNPVWPDINEAQIPMKTA